MKAYAVYCALVLGGFVYTEWRGIPLWRDARRVHVPASVRSSPGGYRSFHFHDGFHGGK